MHDFFNKLVIKKFAVVDMTFQGHWRSLAIIQFNRKQTSFIKVQ